MHRNVKTKENACADKQRTWIKHILIDAIVTHAAMIESTKKEKAEARAWKKEQTQAMALGIPLNSILKDCKDMPYCWQLFDVEQPHHLRASFLWTHNPPSKIRNLHLCSKLPVVAALYQPIGRSEIVKRVHEAIKILLWITLQRRLFTTKMYGRIIAHQR